MKSNVVKLSPYERAVNLLNDLPSHLDKIFSEALEDLRKQRDNARSLLKEVYDNQNAACIGSLLEIDGEIQPCGECLWCRVRVTTSRF